MLVSLFIFLLYSWSITGYQPVLLLKSLWTVRIQSWISDSTGVKTADWQ